MKVLTARGMRLLEAAAVEEGLDYRRLMENAGSAAARRIRTLEGLIGRNAVVLCGSGNNGGDGFVVARKLAEENFAVTAVLLCGQPKSAQAREMYSRMEGLGVSVLNLETEPYMAASAVREAQLVVDAVYGIGFRGDLPDYMRPLFRQVNAAGAAVIAIDVPSGMDCDTGLCDPDALRAERTITFTAMKPGLLSAKASAFCGTVEVVGIGIDERLIDQFTSAQSIIDWDMVAPCFQPRPADSHKGTYGHLLSVCGSYGMAGAAVLAARAALRCGAGLVTAALPPRCIPWPPQACGGIVPAPAGNRRRPPGHGGAGTAAGTAATLYRRPDRLRLGQRRAGAGGGRGYSAQRFLPGGVGRGWYKLRRPAYRYKENDPGSAGPHAPSRGNGPSAWLFHRTGAGEPAGDSRRFAEEQQVILVLKGNKTVIAAPGQTLLVNTTGNPGMATGGSGDVLAGMIASFIAQGMDPYRAAMCGVHLHGLAGDAAAQRLSQHAMLPSDLLEELGGLFLRLE